MLSPEINGCKLGFILKNVFSYDTQWTANKTIPSWPLNLSIYLYKDHYHDNLSLLYLKNINVILIKIISDAQTSNGKLSFILA